MATFRKAASNDIFVSANIAEFGMTKAELESWFKENAIGSTGGGGDITSGEVQTMIDESISGKVDYTVSVPSSSTEVIVTSNDTANIVGYDYLIVPSDMYALTYKHGSSVSPIGYINNGVLTLQSGFTTTGQDEPINVGADDKFTIPISLINTNIVQEVNSWGEYTFVLVKSASTIDVVEQLEKVDEKVNTSDFDTYAESTTSALNSKVGTSAFNSHTGNTNIHVTSSEKQNWNNKLAASAVTSAITENDTNPVAGGAVYDKVHVTSGNGSTTVLTFDGNGTATNYPSGNTKVRLYAGAYNTFEVKFLTSNKCFYWRANYNSEGWTFDASLSSLYCDGPSFTATTSYTDNVLTVEVTNVSTGVPSDIIGLEFWDGFVPSQLAKMEAVEGETAEYWIKDYVDAKVAEEVSGKVISGGTNISVTTGETADTINCTLPLTLEGQTLKTNDEINLFKTNSLYVGFNGVGNAYPYSICLGRGCNTYAVKTIAAGDSCSARKEASQAMGKNIIAQNNSEHSVGQYNVSSSGSSTFGDSGNTLFSIGNGTSTSARHNAFEVRQNGDIYLTKDGQDVKLQDQLGSGSIEVSSAITSGDTNPVKGGALYDELRIVDNISQRTQLIWEDTGGDGVYCFNLPSNCYKVEFVGGNENSNVNITVNGTKAFIALWSGNTWTVSSISQGLTTIIDGSKLTLISSYALNSIESNYYSWSYQTTSYAIVESSSVTPLIDKVKEDEQVTAAALNELNARIAALEAIIQNMNN